MSGGLGRVVVVHDYVTQRGGAERVTLDLLRAFPGSRLVTSCWDRQSSFPEFGKHDIETLWLDRLGVLRRDPRRAFPLLARAFQQHTITDADVVICSSSGWSHRVRTTAPKIVYCHNPARWLYQPEDYFGAMAPWKVRRFTELTDGLRRSDAGAAHSAARYLVNSSTVARRVWNTYARSADIVPPARGLSPEGRREAIPGLQPGFLLTVARARGYKHTDTVRAALAALPGERLVVVGGEASSSAPGVTCLPSVSDAQLRWLYANADALVAVAHEDFGLTAVEAQGFGLPAVVLRQGGYLDSTVEGVTGVFVAEATPACVAAGIRELRSRDWDRAAVRRAGERYAPDAFVARMTRVVDEVLAEEAFVAPAQVIELGSTGKLVPIDAVPTVHIAPAQLA